MDNKEIVKELKSLCQLDIDAFYAYNETMHHFNIVDMKSHIENFKEDHERHIKDLSDAIRSLDEQPPEFSRDFKGYLLGAFTKVRSLTGTEGALKALRSGEESTNKRYGKAVNMDFPAGIKALVEKNYRDAQSHLAYIEKALNERVWKKAA